MTGPSLIDTRGEVETTNGWAPRNIVSFCLTAVSACPWAPGTTSAAYFTAPFTAVAGLYMYDVISDAVCFPTVRIEASLVELCVCSSLAVYSVGCELQGDPDSGEQREK